MGDLLSNSPVGSRIGKGMEKWMTGWWTRRAAGRWRRDWAMGCRLDMAMDRAQKTMAFRGVDPTWGRGWKKRYVHEKLKARCGGITGTAEGRVWTEGVCRHLWLDGHSWSTLRIQLPVNTIMAPNLKYVIDNCKKRYSSLLHFPVDLKFWFIGQPLQIRGLNSWIFLCYFAVIRQLKILIHWFRK